MVRNKKTKLKALCVSFTHYFVNRKFIFVFTENLRDVLAFDAQLHIYSVAVDANSGCVFQHCLCKALLHGCCRSLGGGGYDDNNGAVCMCMVFICVFVMSGH